jgi:hypothetical protein
MCCVSMAGSVGTSPGVGSSSCSLDAGHTTQHDMCVHLRLERYLMPSQTSPPPGIDSCHFVSHRPVSCGKNSVGITLREIRGLHLCPWGISPLRSKGRPKSRHRVPRSPRRAGAAFEPSGPRLRSWPSRSRRTSGPAERSSSRPARATQPTRPHPRRRGAPGHRRGRFRTAPTLDFWAVSFHTARWARP